MTFDARRQQVGFVCFYAQKELFFYLALVFLKPEAFLFLV